MTKPFAKMVTGVSEMISTIQSRNQVKGTRKTRLRELRKKKRRVEASQAQLS
jgi:hypothetical protein